MWHLVSIIILNYNWWKFNRPCLDSVLSQSYKDFEILFVDNNSSDWSVEEVKNAYKQYITAGKIKMIENKHNYGFAEGNNMGAIYADKYSKYICLLNNDTILPSNRLEELVKGMESDPKLGMVGSLVLDKWGEDSMKDLLFKQKKMGVNNYIMETSFRDLTDHEIQTWVFYTTWIGWCSLLYKKDIIQQPFPSFYFAYGEDTYLSLCNLLSWHKAALCVKSLVHHFGSWSFGKKTSLLKAFHGSKNQLCNILIFHRRANRIKIVPIYLLYQFMKLFSWNTFIRFKGLCKAIWWCIANRGKISKQREQVTQLQKITDKQFLTQLSDRIFENIYFLNIPRYQIVIMDILNALCKFYFRLVHIK